MEMLFAFYTKNSWYNITLDYMDDYNAQKFIDLLKDLVEIKCLIVVDEQGDVISELSDRPA